MNPTLIASVPITPVSIRAYGPTFGIAFRPATIPLAGSPSGSTPGVFSSSFRPTTSESRPASAARSFVRWRSNSSGWAASAPRQSRFWLPPHGPGPLSEAVVSSVRKKFSVFIVATRIPSGDSSGPGRSFAAVYAAGPVGWMRQRPKSQLRTPTVFATSSPPRNEFESENAAPFGWRVNSGFPVLRPSSSVIRRTR
jgi:hypothetical protein